MPHGDVLDPRMNSVEKDFGMLISNEIGYGRSKTIPYLKNKVSRNFVAGTPVIFDLEEREVVYCTRAKKKVFLKIEIATNVRLDEEKMKDHPVIQVMNACAKKILSMNRIKPEG